MSDETSDQQRPADEGPQEELGRRASMLSTHRDSGVVDPTSPPPSARRLTRRTDRKVLGGVASGIAAYFDIDPVIVRLGFVALVFVIWVFAPLLYLIAWAIVPADTEAASGSHGDGGKKVAITLLAIIGAIIALPVISGFLGLLFATFDGGRRFEFWPGFGDQGFGPFGVWRPGVFWALILVGLGVLLFRRSEAASRETVVGQEGALPAAVALPERPRRPPSILGRLTVAAGLLVAGLAALLENLGVFDLSAHRLLALLLVVVGIGLLVGAWWGRARWLIAVGAILLPIVFAASMAPFFGPRASFSGDIRDYERTVRPTTLAEASDPIDLPSGDLTLDLTAVPLTADPTPVRADVGAGRLEVVVPDGAAVDVRATVGLGSVDLFDEMHEGPALDVTAEHPGSADGGRLTLDLGAGLGEIVVREQPASPAQLLPSSFQPVLERV